MSSADVLAICSWNQSLLLSTGMTYLMLAYPSPNMVSKSIENKSQEASGVNLLSTNVNLWVQMWLCTAALGHRWWWGWSPQSSSYSWVAVPFLFYAVKLCMNNQNHSAAQPLITLISYPLQLCGQLFDVWKGHTAARSNFDDSAIWTYTSTASLGHTCSRLVKS